MFVFRSTGCLHEITVPEVNMVSCRVDDPNRLLLVEDLCRQSDAEHPFTSASDRGKRHETEYHQTHPSFSPCSTQTETTEETLQLCVILWEETCRELNMDSTAEKGWRTTRAYRALGPAHVICLDYINVKDYRYINCCNVTLSYLCSKYSRHKSTCMRQAYGSNNGVTKKTLWIQQRIFLTKEPRESNIEKVFFF